MIDNPTCRSNLQKKVRKLSKREKDKLYKECVESQQWCIWCGSSHWLQIHHVRYSNGRYTYKGNLALLCQSCHSKAHSNEKKYKPMLVEIVNEFYGLDLPVNYKPY